MRLELDSRVRTARFRGVQLDSIARQDVVTDASGGQFTPSGFAVHCVPGRTFCTFFLPGPERVGGPFVTTADAAIWGLGVPGLSVRARARLGVDLGSGDVWPGTDPAIELLDAYAEYAHERFTARAGRTFVASRLGFTGFDGAHATVRLAGGALAVEAYGGWGLARATALPVTSPALNPLDEYQPRRRQLLAGASASFASSLVGARIVYERQVDPRSDQFVSERVGIDAVVRPVPGLTVAGGTDVDLAAGVLGSAEASVALALFSGHASAQVGARQYRPHFELWTIWGAFSPVPYRAVFGSLTVSPVPTVQLHTRAEAFRFDDTDVVGAFTDVESDGWRWRVQASYRPTRDAALRVAYTVEAGSGAGSLGLDIDGYWRPVPVVTVSARVTRLLRALEFRFSDADVWLYGVNGEIELSDRIRLHTGGAYYREARDRLGAASFTWDQVRLTAGIRVRFGRTADDWGVPPAVLQIPVGEAGS